MKKLMISGNARPVIGQKEMYSVSFADENNGHPHEHWLNPSGSLYENPLQAAGTHWEVMVKTGTGWRKGGSAKEGQTVPYTFGQKSLMHRGIKIVARQGKHTAELVVHTQRAKEPKLLKVELLDANYRSLPKGKVLSYRDTVIARAYCVEMFNMQIAFTLWEDDALGPGHNPAVNALNKINLIPLLGIVNSKGVAEVVFRLPSYTMAVVIANARMAPGDRSEGAAHEYYVTVDLVSRNIQKASPNVNVANPMHHPDLLQSNRPERKAARPPKVKPVPAKPKPRPDSPKFPVTTGGESRSDDREKLLHAEFVDAAGKRLHSSRVGSTAVMKITARNMNHKKVRVKVWEQDNLLWTHDLIYDSSWILTGDENYISLQLTKEMFDKARDGGTDNSRQDYFIEVIHYNTSVTSEVLPVSLDAPPAKAEKGRSVSVVDEPEVEKKNTGKCPNCDKDITIQDLKTIFSNATIDKLKIVADTYNKYMKDLQMNTCWNKAHFFAQAKIESGSALSLKEGEGFNYYWKALIDTFSAFQTEEGKNKAKYWGRAIQNRKDPRAIDVSIETQKKIANYVYSPPAKKAIELGNTEPTDGWNYRGRGLIQVTGRSFYEYCNPYTLKYNNIDVVRNPDEVGTNLEIAVSSAMIFFKWKNINSLANITRDVIGKICPKVGNDIIKNGVSKNYQEKQDTFDNITSKIFKLNECKLKRFIESGNLTKLNKKGKYNIDAAVAYITNNSETKSLGKCAKYVRLAINAGGITNIYGNATEYYDTDKLVKYGFTKIGTDLNSIQLKKGDIVAFGSVKGHSYGHIAMWTGNEWISDFKQKSFWVANQYSVEKKYAIYRWEE